MPSAIGYRHLTLKKWVDDTFETAVRLLQVENVYLLVTGENKKNIVTEIVKNTGDFPINKLISLREETTLITDQV